VTRKECEQIEPFLTGYLDEALFGEEFKRVQNHLRTCPDCSAAVEEYGKIGQLIRTALRSESEEASFDRFGETVMDRVRRESSREKPAEGTGWKRLLFPSGIAAGTLALAAAVLLWIQLADRSTLQTGPAFETEMTGHPEMARLQGELGLSIRDYAYLKFNLIDRHLAFEASMERLKETASQYPDPGTYQEELGRTIRDYGFVFYRGRQLGGGEQEKIGEKIRDVARLQYQSREKIL
jgi:hypothetical protein